MSCDFAVWYPKKKLTKAEAGTVYRQLCDGRSELVKPHPSIKAFYCDITALHPEIDDVPDEDIDNEDVCPWDIAFDKSEGHLIMPCMWSKAQYVEGLVRRLARKHRLAVYDPQTGAYYPPEDGEQENNKKHWWIFW